MIQSHPHSVAWGTKHKWVQTLAHATNQNGQTCVNYAIPFALRPSKGRAGMSKHF